MIRSLLIDNYDSYTYNLFQLMAQVYGVDPVVVHNDDPRCVELADELGCVVISPGPGDPRDPHDFGMCAEVLQQTQVTTLALRWSSADHHGAGGPARTCRGHQGLHAVPDSPTSSR
jgi:para-aminobenzoate synthetase